MTFGFTELVLDHARYAADLPLALGL